MKLQHRVVSTLVALALGATAACGTTVPDAERAALRRSGDGLSLGGDVAATSGVDPVAGDGELGAATPGASSPRTAGGRSSASTAPSARNGVTRSPVIVGIHYIKGVNELASALGIGGLATGDAVAQGTAVANEINARGGLGGRPIKIVSHGAEVGEAEQQAACTKFTQDLGARIIVSYFQLPGSVLACYAKAGAVVIDDLGEVVEDDAARGKGYFYAPGDFLKGRVHSALVDSLVQSGWLTKNSKVGLYFYNDNDVLVNRYVRPALARHGIKVASAGSVSREASGISENSGLVLKFAAAGVDRVIPVAISPLFLMQAASSQGYRPRYAVTSGVGPGALLESSAPRDQLTGAAGLGYQPYSDIGRGTKPGPVSANETRCLKIMRDAGLESTGAVTLLAQMAMCDSFFFMAAVLAEHPAADAAAFAAGVAKMGTSFATAITFQSHLVGGRPDGAAAYRELRFEDGCECFQYVGGVKPA